MPDPVARGGVRSVTLVLSENAFAALASEAGRQHLAPAAYAAAMVERGLTSPGGTPGRLQPVPGNSGAGSLPMVRVGSQPGQPVGRPLPEVRFAALSTRARALRRAWSLSYCQAATLDILLEGRRLSAFEMMQRMPLDLRPPTIASQQTMVCKLRRKLGLTAEQLRCERPAVYSLSDAGLSIVLSRGDAA